MPATRRLFLAAPALLLATRGFAQAPVGVTLALTGQAILSRGNAEQALHPDDPLHEGDTVSTGAASLAALELFTATRINLGPEARFMLDRFAADLGGTITIGGAMVFDRPDTLAPLDLEVQSTFARIGVRGTRFYAGPSRGVFGIFVQRGRVEVMAAGQTRHIGAGEGVNIPAPGAAPSEVSIWGAERIVEAFTSVGLTP
jgi:hypothetical protein